jgi:hypothetical protein
MFSFKEIARDIAIRPASGHGEDQRRDQLGELPKRRRRELFHNHGRLTLMTARARSKTPSELATSLWEAAGLVGLLSSSAGTEDDMSTL